MASTTSALRTILLEGNAHTQLEIRKKLERDGIVISQPKASRLLNQIGAVKLVDGQGKTQYRLPHESGLIHELSSPQEKMIMKQWVLSITSNETMIVIHTTPGAASMVARVVDQHRIQLDTLGTIAGDDTIFIAPKSNEAIIASIQKITQLLNL
tara:strand:- start:873 stop:1334 length:462 start_codon:yes stop_codon:yes gene_type:complete